MLRLAILCMIMLLNFIGYQADAATISCLNEWKNFSDDLPQGFRDKIEIALNSHSLTPEKGKCSTALLQGEIEKGDAAEFKGFLISNFPHLHSIVLNSSGGLVEEGMKIGGLVRKYLLSTRAPTCYNFNEHVHCVLFSLSPNYKKICKGADCNCASTCFLIWSGGVVRTGNAIGLHRPSIQFTSYANMPPDKASALYKQLIAEIDDYLSEMEIPKNIVEKMNAVHSAEIIWLHDEAKALAEVPSISEWLYSDCDRLTEIEKKQRWV